MRQYASPIITKRRDNSLPRKEKRNYFKEIGNLKYETPSASGLGIFPAKILMKTEGNNKRGTFKVASLSVLILTKSFRVKRGEFFETKKRSRDQNLFFVLKRNMFVFHFLFTHSTAIFQLSSS